MIVKYKLAEITNTLAHSLVVKNRYFVGPKMEVATGRNYIMDKAFDKILKDLSL